MGVSVSKENKVKARRGEPIEALGLTFYPITMSHYEDFLSLKNILTLRVTTLPVQYVSMSYLSALWAVDIDCYLGTGKALGVFERVMKLLYLTLRLEYSKEVLDKTVYCDSKSPRELVRIEVKQNNETISITPREFASKIRPIIAEQNGLKLPNESYNPQLVQAEHEMAEDQQGELNFDIDALISSVAYQSKIPEREIYDWTVLQFEHRREAIDRDKNYMLFRQAELSGMVKFPKGNPFPSWCFDKSNTLSPVLRRADDLKGNFAALGDITLIFWANSN